MIEVAFSLSKLLIQTGLELRWYDRLPADHSSPTTILISLIKFSSHLFCTSLEISLPG